MGTRHWSAAVAAVVALTLAAAGCTATAATTTTPSTPSARAVTLPPTTGAADYQLGGAYAPPSGVTVVTRDSTEKPARGIYSICYVNGFQTQPGASWPDDLILHTPSGAPLVDPGWPDEHLLDISTAAKRSTIAARLAPTIDSCARAGFRGVEFDNLDSYSRSKGALTLDDAVAFAGLLTTRAHRDHLAAGQKNTAELGRRGRDAARFDFAVTEECDRFSECRAFTGVYGAHVLDIEYTDDLRGTFAEVCARKATPRLTILRDRDLVARGQSGYVYRRC
ncbi:hypothetical protein AS850_13460 [Frondihabitans sp. 762G35]|uniref:endo alpha-1,4 polygalactosaminidase n=1 Tax=Frondihabitans sp. 762G35 TaxID=1446794 RepID=UPI000D1FE4DF|nr:endo alpha-1,4 polygalactosaminidase [Frondihabitans sp. 762G35]ARC58085.1 hypothetical protein AS850_13460 [Frondihabitans sp. 762G35]